MPDRELVGGLASIGEVTKLVGPPQLSPGANFYDQAPFNHVLPKVAQERGLDQATLQGMLTRVATPRRVNFAQAASGENSFHSDFETAFHHARTSTNRAREKTGEDLLPVTDYQRYMSAMPEVLASLSKYPDIKAYIKEGVKQGTYLPDGTFLPAENRTTGGLSYIQWAKERFTGARPIPRAEPLIDQVRAKASGEAPKVEVPDKIIEIEGPEQLEVGQNFLDQPPFDQALSDEAQKSGISLEELRAEFLDRVKTGRTNLDALRARSYKMGPKFRAFINVLDALKDYPYIEGYVQSRFNIGLYANDGSWYMRGSGTPSADSMPDSYAKWLPEKIAREKRLGNQVLLGIDQVFPQDFGLSKTGLPEGGSGRIRRRFIILRAAELVPERKR